MKHAATTTTADGKVITGRGHTLPAAVRDAAKKRAEHERSKITITIAEGVTYVRRS